MYGHDVDPDLTATPGLAGLAASELAVLSCHLAPRSYTCGATIIGPGTPNECHFIRRGLVAILFGARGGEQIGVSLLGFDGFLGIAPLLESHEVAHSAVALSACETLYLTPSDLRQACEVNEKLKVRLLQYTYLRTADAMQSALCHLQHPLERRLASWILTASDLLLENTIQITHRRLSTLLGVRRPTMTIGLQNLEASRAIRSQRTTIIVRDRAALRQICCSCYGARQRLRQLH
jgi:CRP-like cAMP-binding protein